MGSFGADGAYDWLSWKGETAVLLSRGTSSIQCYAHSSASRHSNATLGGVHWSDTDVSSFGAGMEGGKRQQPCKSLEREVKTPPEIVLGHTETSIRYE